MTRMHPSLALPAVLLLTATAGCGGPEASVDYAGKRVPINVAFGKPAVLEGEEPPEPVALQPGPSGIGVVPKIGGPPTRMPPPPAPQQPKADPAQDAAPPPVPVPAPPSASVPPADPVCPAQDPLAFPRTEAPNVVPDPAPNGLYPYRVNGSFTVDGETTPYAETMDVSVENATRDANGFGSFDTRYVLLGVPFTVSYRVTPPTDLVPGEIGLAATVQEGENGASFRPVEPLRLMQLRAGDGVSFREAANDPLSATTATVDGTVAGKARVNACGQPIDTWKVVLTQRTVTPDQNITATKTLFFATQFGGLPVSEVVSYTGTAGGNTVEGESTMTINVDPGAP